MAEDDETNPRHHHDSHHSLVLSAESELPDDIRPDLTGAPRIDAIIVPTIRPSTQLTAAIGHAKELGCTLLALCSKKSVASEVLALALEAGIDAVAIDVDRMPPNLLPHFKTTDVLKRRLFRDPRDTATKRNLALLFATLAGWRRVFFLDDDITIDSVELLRSAARELSWYEVAGLRVEQYPDNSVVCHAGREVGRPQQTFVGGGAIAVDVLAAESSFFPQVYNEDWLFLLDEHGLRPTTVVGEASQAPYDPFTCRRAWFEEVGDTLAEGVFWLLDEGRKVGDATPEHWRMFLAERKAFISELLGAVISSDLPLLRRAKIGRALLASYLRNRRIKPDLCYDYLLAWHSDRRAWRQHVDDWRATYHDAESVELREPEKVLATLGLLDCAHFVRTEDTPAQPSVVAALHESSDQH